MLVKHSKLFLCVQNSIIQRNASTSYSRQLLKKFMFQVHPDYFMNNKVLQDINATNLNNLQSLVDGTMNEADIGGTKSLTFYLKPDFNDRQPQKVKVSTTRIEGSIAEILETIGVSVPEDTQAAHTSRYSVHNTVMASPEQTLEFLTSMYERRDLISLRARRITHLNFLIEELKELTGASNVLFRNSWSSHNNALLVAKAISIISQHSAELDFPWRNMSIAFTKEEGEQRINYVDREICLTSADVPEQILSVLQSVKVSAIQESDSHMEQIDKLKARFESAATAILIGTLNQKGVQGISTVNVRVRRGFTCSMSHFYYFLYMMNKQELILNATRIGVSNMSPGSSSAGLQNNPVVLTITIEDSHGTKILPDGSFRIDVRADTEIVYTLLHNNAKGLAELAGQHQQMRVEIAKRKKGIISLLGLESLEPGKGVSEEHFLEFLQQLDAYGSHSDYLNALLQLQGLRVVVGHYLGVADDGACILPWEFALPAEF